MVARHVCVHPPTSKLPRWGIAGSSPVAPLSTHRLLRAPALPSCCGAAAGVCSHSSGVTDGTDSVKGDSTFINVNAMYTRRTKLFFVCNGSVCSNLTVEVLPVDPPIFSWGGLAGRAQPLRPSPLLRCAAGQLGTEGGAVQPDGVNRVPQRGLDLVHGGFALLSVQGGK